MVNTSNFDDWLEENRTGDYREIYDLYRSVATRQGQGKWRITTQSSKTFVKGDFGNLELLTENARKAFLGVVEALKDDPGMTMEGWYEFHRSMEKPD